MDRKKLTELQTVPKGVKGIFAANNISGCYGDFGLYLWGDGKHIAMTVMGSKENVYSPKMVSGLVNVEKVQVSETHIIVMCGTADSKKREGECVEEKESKMAKME